MVSRLVHDQNHPEQVLNLGCTLQCLGKFLKSLIKKQDKKNTLKKYTDAWVPPPELWFIGLLCNIDTGTFQTSQSFDSNVQSRLRTTEEGPLDINNYERCARTNKSESLRMGRRLIWSFPWCSSTDWPVWILLCEIKMVRCLLPT